MTKESIGQGGLWRNTENNGSGVKAIHVAVRIVGSKQVPRGHILGDDQLYT